MRSGIALAIGVLLVLVPARTHARADAASPGSMSIPVRLADLAAAAGVLRADPSTLPLDMIRAAFAGPDGANDESAARRAAIRHALGTPGDSGDRLPLPLSPRTWRARVAGTQVPDDRLAAAIFSRRVTALLYHGLLALDPPTLDWIDAHPAVLETLQKRPGATAAFARSIHVRNGAVVTPGDDANGVWEGIVGADPRDAAPFIARLMSARSGRLVAFYDAVAHLDAARQRFALGAPGEPNRIERVRRLADIATRDAPAWRIEESPFMRPDLDVSLLFRRLTLDARGMPAGPSRRVWAEVFDESVDGDGPVEPAWLAAAVLIPGGPASRRRFDTFFFAQRVLAADSAADEPALVAALRGFSRHPTLMLTLENNGVRAAAAYAAAARAAAALGRDSEAITVFQSALAIADRARQAGTLGLDETRRLIGQLMDGAASGPPRAALLAWFQNDLLPSLKAAAPASSIDAEALVLHALAGPSIPPGTGAVEWEGHRYAIDLAGPELRRLLSIRRSQQETPLGDALAAATPGNLSVLSHSLAALVYALAIGQPDSPASNGGPVWRRHRFAGLPSTLADGFVAWRLATEVFGPDGWHLTGSLLRLDVALAPLALRRLDPTEMPAASSLSAMDRRTLARTIALMDRRSLALDGDAARDAVAAALARGRERVKSLAGHPDALEAIAVEAALSEWRRAGIRWLIANDAARVPGAFTLVELFRLGGGTTPAGWGAAADALDGCLCLRMPDAAAWEEYAGRPSTGQLAAQLADVMLRTAEALSVRRLPGSLIRDVAAFAMQDAMDAARPAYLDDWLSVAFAARDLRDDRFDDYVAALTASGPLVPVQRTIPR